MKTKVTCPRCHGDGKWHPRNDEPMREGKCPNCNGTGFIPAEGEGKQ